MTTLKSRNASQRANASIITLKSQSQRASQGVNPSQSQSDAVNVIALRHASRIKNN